MLSKETNEPHLPTKTVPEREEHHRARSGEPAEWVCVLGGGAEYLRWITLYVVWGDI